VKSLVKIITQTGEEERFDSKDVKRDLQKAGMPERVAEEVAERVDERVEDHWTSAKVNEQVDVELGRLEEDIQRAHDSYKSQINTTVIGEGSMTEIPRSETFVPESEKERHDRRHDII
jgi:ribosome recycling factor